MRIGVLELPASWGEPARVLDRVDEALSRGPAADVILLPEASLVGYVSPQLDFDVTPFAEPIDGPSAQRLAAIARAHGVHLFAPLVEREGAHVYNAMIGLAPSGALLTRYRKRHPWYPEQWATPGEAPFTCFDLLGRRAMIAICFDLHFLREEAEAALRQTDVLLFPSAWVEKDDERPVLLPALAREFGTPIVNANWAPGVVRVPGQGGSAIYGADGAVIARVHSGVLRVDATL